MRRFEPSSATARPPQGPDMDRVVSSAAKPASSLRVAAEPQSTRVTCTPHERRHHFPPWPIDTIEFNALSVDGGQGARIAWEQTHHEGSSKGPPYNISSSSFVGDNKEEFSAAGSLPKTVPLTPETLRRLAAEEERPTAQAALAVGGWVCTGCWAVQGVGSTAKDVVSTESGVPDAKHSNVSAVNTAWRGLFPRTVCSACQTLRHDVHTWPLLAALRVADSSRWICRHCGEVNSGGGNVTQDGRAGGAQHGAPACRCCGNAMGGDASEGTLVRRTVADEVEEEAPGHVVVIRNRTTRWRCCNCAEVNSLQLRECRNCARGRFALEVSCPQCQASRSLSNALIYGDEERESAQGAALSSGSALCVKSPVFSPLNCYRSESTQLMCLQCDSPLHGGAVRSFTHGSAPWWCACGVMNPTQAYSCYRCRMPRTVSNPLLLKALLRNVMTSDPSIPSYDFSTCTSWFCGGCDSVNHAAYQVIEERYAATHAAPPPSGEGSSPPSTSRRKVRVWADEGELECGHCGAPWHHQLLQDGELWRCACHALNKRGDALCMSCGLPALDGVQAIVLSAWSKGDWWCCACSTHNYRDRLRCRCGAHRPVMR
ncbi:hypothetical protein ABL78_1848 [Leptomonas seymouri]|uniref:RanBP2-type domain-containing protein n=1 Tax=Leptomonas seymouri TaxID=5684 RepID=A0A0N1PDJ9_LEPSE|nr:hypothetical protein ABL78_1848 [Leptomonas seymouri]|eukprot:KPI89035.1 hypothetical protein ABL78_1848 [Leptomonas seymouri]